MACNAKDIEGMVQSYPLLVEAVIEYKRFSRRFQAESKGTYYLLPSKFSHPYIGEIHIESSNVSSITMAKGFTLAYSHVEEKHYCLEDG